MVDSVHNDAFKLIVNERLGLPELNFLGKIYGVALS